jgi:hypothetical protein
MRSKDIALPVTFFFNDMLSVEEEKKLYCYVMDDRNRHEVIEWLQLLWQEKTQPENVPSEAMFSKIKEKIVSNKIHEPDRTLYATSKLNINKLK